MTQIGAGALRSKDRKAPASHIAAKWDPTGGLFVDFVIGTISTSLKDT